MAISSPSCSWWSAVLQEQPRIVSCSIWVFRSLNKTDCNMISMTEIVTEDLTQSLILMSLLNYTNCKYLAITTAKLWPKITRQCFPCPISVRAHCNHGLKIRHFNAYFTYFSRDPNLILKDMSCQDPLLGAPILVDDARLYLACTVQANPICLAKLQHHKSIVLMVHSQVWEPVWLVLFNRGNFQDDVIQDPGDDDGINVIQLPWQSRGTEMCILHLQAAIGHSFDSSPWACLLALLDRGQLLQNVLAEWDDCFPHRHTCQGLLQVSGHQDLCCLV